MQCAMYLMKSMNGTDEILYDEALLNLVEAQREYQIAQRLMKKAD